MIKGNNTHGFTNETNVANHINGKTYNELNLNIKRFIDYIVDNEEIDINKTIPFSSFVESSNKLKQDLYIIITDINLAEHKVSVSTKMGSGNSVHQEKCEDFISYIKTNFNASEEICNSIRFFIWSDGTLDGSAPMDKDDSGKILTRFTKNEFLKSHQDKATIIQNFFDQNKKELINHFLFVGRWHSKVDYLYHGTEIAGKWISSKKLIEFLLLNEDTSKEKKLNISGMTFQTWNVSQSGNTEQKRGQIQIKFAKLNEKLTEAMMLNMSTDSPYWGQDSEFNLTKELNRNKNHKFWKILLPKELNLDTYYIVQVDSNIMSTLNSKKVKAKSDAFVVKAELERDFLIKHEYLLLESLLAGIEYEKIQNSGISIKKKDSNKYTIQKLSYHSFESLFKDANINSGIIFLSLLFYEKDTELYKNDQIIKDFNLIPNEFIKKVNDIFATEFKVLDKETISIIRTLSQGKLKSIISDSRKIKEMIFMGKGCFNEPYSATFIYKHGNLSQDFFTDIAITTGSGRSKGEYNIAIKPR